MKLMQAFSKLALKMDSKMDDCFQCRDKMTQTRHGKNTERKLN